jgi:signal transduction histidine kinase
MHIYLKILCLEDTLEDVELITRALKKEGLTFLTHIVDSKDDFENALLQFQPEVILSDHALPQFNSLAALKMMKEKGLKVPFILVTGTVSEEFAVSCLKQGADDYILKSNLMRLPSAIRNALQKKQTELKRENAERTLRQQNEELVKVNHELDRFVYSVSHNLRAPLMSILGLINLWKHDAQSESGSTHYFDMMESSVHKLDETLKEILDYSKNARVEINHSPVDIRQLVIHCVDSLKYLNHFDQIDLQMTITDDGQFQSDADRIKVIISNLLSNAIKYMDPLKSRSFIKIEAIASASELQFRISDNGIGIAPELQTKIFNMFFRATERSDGAGLGLYIVSEAVKKLSGSIEVKSVVGEGSAFILRVPGHGS